MPEAAIKTDTRPTSAAPAPLVVLTGAERASARAQGERIAARRAEKEKGNLRLGGAAGAAAAGGVMAAGQVGQMLRPSQQLKIWANYGETAQDHKDALLKWMNDNLKDAELEMGKVTAGITAATHIAIPGLLLAKDAALVAKDIAKEGKDLVTSAPQKTINVVTELAQVLGADIAAVSSSIDVLGIVPFVAPIFNLCAAAGYTTFIIMTAWNKIQSQSQHATSCSVIEQVGLEAVIRCDNADIADKSAALAKSLVSVAAAPTGLAGAITLPMSAVHFVVKFVLLIKEIIDVRAANEQIAKGQIDNDLLKKHPVLGLTLPHLQGVDALALLGILPLGWTQDHPGLKRLRQEARKPENRWIYNALWQINLFNRKEITIDDVWREDFERVVRLMMVTNYHLYEERFVLVKRSSRKSLYVAPPVTRWQEVKQFIKQKFMGSKGKTTAETNAAVKEAGAQLADNAPRDPKQEQEDLQQQINDRGGDAASLFAEKTMYAFQETAREIAGDSDGGEEPPAAQGPIATLIHVAPAPSHAENGMMPAAPLPQPAAIAQAAAAVESYLGGDDVETDDDLEIIRLDH
ncbi:MAG: hypothetical protein K1X65_14855 [Caldilineales bacterium]|nr:hypothetical protein [Caldilineales bacterium]